MGEKFLVSPRLTILNQAETSGNITEAARAHNVPPNQIRYWRNRIENLIEKLADNGKARTVKN